ncbi:MAG: glycoside hydrolase family 2 protein [Anaerolineae bacterium]|nr:glycoside hydrolase family 2 protein [Anaerolineae bacterium]
MRVETLDGVWELVVQEGQTIPATVPGCVHTDLLAAGLIEDPYYRDNELDVMWIGETDWTYRRRFAVDSQLLDHERVLLRCHGLDTLATLSINGQQVARTDNMFRTWEYDIKMLLREGENRIEVRFGAAMPYVRVKGQERMLPAWSVGDHKLDGGGWIRKEPCNFGWDWGPKLVTCGIWRDIELVAFDTARLRDVQILQDHSQEGQVILTVRVQAESTGSDALDARIEVSRAGTSIAQAAIALVDGAGEAQLAIAEPELWWPHGMGDQPLYDVTVQLLDASGQALDRDERRIGLRTLRLVRKFDPWGQSFHFEANGVPFFAKGANWIPDDTFATRLTPDTYRHSLQDAVDANMNMLRVWGGGLYEADVFYDLCDEMGLCVWQDFIFACATYPTFDSAFMANVAVEGEENIRRLRHHPSLALWCGNNELEQGLVGDIWTDRTMSWLDYAKLFDDLLPRLVRQLDPERDYWPSSAHTPIGNRENANDPRSGDAHLWSVWHGKMPFEWYRTCEHRFNSEFGFQSFPEPKTVYSYTAPQDRNITSYVMEHHQRSGIGNTTIMTYMLDWFRLPTSFESTLWLSQILQGMAIKYAVEHWRRGMPRGMGTLYWQLNDCWPVASWSSVDSLGRWKALHYMARHFYAPLLISGLEDIAAGSVEIHVTSDRLQPCEGQIGWTLTNVAGQVLANGERSVMVCANGDTLAESLDLKAHLDRHGIRDTLLWLDLQVDGQIVSRNLVTFARPKHLELIEPEIHTSVENAGDGSFLVTLEADKPVLWAWLELAETDARYSDNFVHLCPGRPAQIVVTPSAPLGLNEFRSRLMVRSLIDTYQP